MRVTCDVVREPHNLLESQCRHPIPADRLGEPDYIHNGHTPGDGYGPDVDPLTGDESETEEIEASKSRHPSNATDRPNSGRC